MAKMYAQGDVLLVEIDPVDIRKPRQYDTDPDGLTVLARGEKHGHRHGFWDKVAYFRDDALGRDVVVVEKAAELVQHALDPAHPADHDPVQVPPGTYELRKQRRLEITAPDDSRIVQALD